MNRLLMKYLRAIVGNLLIAAILATVLALIISVTFKAVWLTVFLFLGIAAISINTLALAVTYFTLRDLTKQLADVPYDDLYDAYVVYRIQRKLPLELWTRQRVYANLALFKTTGGKPLT